MQGGCERGSELLPSQFPQLKAVLECAVLARNEVCAEDLLSKVQEYCDAESPEKLCEGDQVAVIPPISGG